jgi:site-specific recombinase
VIPSGYFYVKFKCNQNKIKVMNEIIRSLSNEVIGAITVIIALVITIGFGYTIILIDMYWQPTIKKLKSKFKFFVILIFITIFVSCAITNPADNKFAKQLPNKVVKPSKVKFCNNY